MLDFIIQGFVLLVIAGGAYYIGQNRAYFVTKYPSAARFLPNWTRVETP